MKNVITIFILVVFIVFNSCENRVVDESSMIDDNLELPNEAIELMSIAIAKSMKYEPFRQLIRRETNKQFDYDYDVLYRFIDKVKLNIDDLGEISVSDLLINQLITELGESKLVKENYLRTIDEKIPNLNICVPFQYKDWDYMEYIPNVVAFPTDFDEKTHTEVNGYNQYGNKSIYTKEESNWELPVVTVGISERIDEDGYLKVNAGSIILDKEDRCITADEAYSFATSYLKSGIKLEFDPFVEIIDDESFLEGQKDLDMNILPYNNSITNNEEFSHKGLSDDCTNPLPTKLLKMYPAIDYSQAVTLEWEDVLADNYEIWRAIGSGDMTLLAHVSGTQQRYTNTGLFNGTTYQYKIRARNGKTCYSAFTPIAHHRAGWRRGSDYEYLDKIYMNKTCWKDISWGRSKIEVYIKAVKYNFSNSTLEYPKMSMGQVSRDSQENKWRTYNKLLFLWDMTNYATNYWIYFYEEDGGNPVTVKLGAKIWYGNPTNPKTPIGGEVSVNVEFQVGGRDDRFGFLEVYNHTLTNSSYGIDIQPPKGAAKAIILSKSN